MLSNLNHWGWVTHKCICKIIINGSDNGLSPSGHQASISINAAILLILPLGTNFKWNFDRNHLRKSFENVVWKIAAILCFPNECVKNWNELITKLCCISSISCVFCWLQKWILWMALCYFQLFLADVNSTTHTNISVSIYIVFFSFDVPNC